MLSYPKIGYKSKTTSLNINLPMENSNKKEIDKLKKVDKLIKKLDEGNWSLSDERVFMEKLYVGRFNYFLVVFSLFVTAGFANNFTNCKCIVFYFGGLILFMCWMPLIRAYKKFNNIIKILLNDKKSHTVYILQEIMKKKGFKSKLVISRWMGIYIPILCILFLLSVGVLISVEIIK